MELMNLAGNFWSDVNIDYAYLSVINACKFLNLLLETDKEYITSLYTLETTPIHRTLFPVPITLQNHFSLVSTSYPVTENKQIINIPSLQDRILNPTITLYCNEHYTFLDGTLTFDNSIKDLEGKTFWASVLYDERVLEKKYGSLLGLSSP